VEIDRFGKSTAWWSAFSPIVRDSRRSVLVCTNGSGPCTQAPNFYASLNAPYSCWGDPPVGQGGCGTDGQINVLLTSPTAGNYYFQVSTATDATGNAFLGSSSETSGGNSNMASFEVAAGPTLQLLAYDSQSETETDVANTTQSVLVGHWVDLTAVVNNPGPWTYTFQWSPPPGNTVTSWSDKLFPSQPPTTLSAQDLQDDEIGFAWVDTSGSGQQLQVSVQPSYGGTPLTATVTYNISLPGVTLEPAQEQSAVVAPNCPGRNAGTTAMCLFDPPTTQGIVMPLNGYTAPYDIEWLQVINASAITYTNSSGAGCTDSITGLDGGQAYPFCPATPDSIGICDSPGVVLPAHPGDQEETMAMDASSFVMFKPDFTSEDDILVPIGRVDWFWSGDAYLFASWLMIGSNPLAGGTVVPPAQTSGYPSWGLNPALPLAPCAEMPALAGLAIASPVTSRSSATITVTLNGPAPSGGAVVSLAGGSSVFSVPSTCTVLAGAVSQSCSGTGGTVTSSTTVTINATYNNSSQSATVTVVP